MARTALTTIDNPFNPFTEYEKWFGFEVEHGYNTAAYVARVAHTSDLMSDYEEDEEIEKAIDDAIRLDPFGIYKKVVDTSSYA